jgi:hypothetical protein
MYMVNTITEIIWDIVSDDEELLAELTRIMCQEYEPCLSKDKAATVNTYKFENYLREELTKWYEWLPDTPINQIGGELAMEAFADVDWRHRAALVLAGLQIGGSAT